MTRRTHDAELCDRIRELEERVKELEAAPRTTYVPWFGGWWQPYPGTTIPNPYPWIPWYGTTTGTLTTARGITTGDTYTIGDIS